MKESIFIKGEKETMHIGEFVEMIQTSKDTVRYYEELNLIDPIRNGDKRDYTEKDIQDFHIIKEMQAIGLTIREIQIIFHLKRSAGFQSPSLLQDIQDKLYTSIKKIEQAERELAIRRMKTYRLLSYLDSLHKNG